MDIQRRDFIKGCVTASVLLLPGIADAATHKTHKTNKAGLKSKSHIEKSIKASFGDGFSVRDFTQSKGRTIANIENFGNRYKVSSTNLLDWKIDEASF
jgi:hypothetical protein